MLSTVKDCTMAYSKRAYKRALLARKLQNIICDQVLESSKTWSLNILTTAQLPRLISKLPTKFLARILGLLKGKTVQQSAGHVTAGVDAILPEVLCAARNVSIAIDIMSVNKIPFFITISRDIKFGTVETIPNQ
jgi:hypothetical protein